MLDPLIAHGALLIVCLMLTFPVLLILDQAMHLRHHARSNLDQIDSERPKAIVKPETREDDPCRSSSPPRS